MICCTCCSLTSKASSTASLCARCSASAGEALLALSCVSDASFSLLLLLRAGRVLGLRALNPRALGADPARVLGLFRLLLAVMLLDLRLLERSTVLVALRPLSKPDMQLCSARSFCFRALFSASKSFSRARRASNSTSS